MRILKEGEFTLREIEKDVWEIDQHSTMRVPGRVYGDDEIINALLEDVRSGRDWHSLKQITNVAALPGIQKASYAMADVHPGYGFCIGGVGAFDLKEGVVSVAGVGFDCNCGVRALRTPLSKADVLKVQDQLAEALFKTIPAGVGSKGLLDYGVQEVDKILTKGAPYMVEKGFGLASDLPFIEEHGCVDGADPTTVSETAKLRQARQFGTLGSGNHYLEVQYVDEIFDEEAAKAFGVKKDQVLVFIHCGSRALGHQIGTDYLQKLEKASKKYNIPIMERELVCAPIDSPEGREYMAAVNCGINCAFANRQILCHLTREALVKVFGLKPYEVETLYEVAHNTAKYEKHEIGGVQTKVLVLRKGATRAFGPGREEVPEQYRAIGQPVLVGGTMGTSSYLLHGTEKGMKETFGSALHGAGRIKSRTKSITEFTGREVVRQLHEKGIIIKGHSLKGIAEEAPDAYKDVDSVVQVMHDAGIVEKVARLKPLICIKG